MARRGSTIPDVSLFSEDDEPHVRKEFAVREDPYAMVATYDDNR
jgi:hypothetical protein